MTQSPSGSAVVGQRASRDQAQASHRRRVACPARWTRSRHSRSSPPGSAAGAINAVVGSGTLITFPVLIALGYSPLIANVSNNIGLVPGASPGRFGYRRELAGQRRRLIALGIFSVVGGLAGATLLLVLPVERLRRDRPGADRGRAGARRRPAAARPRASRDRGRDGEHERGPLLRAAVAASGVYGGYFGAGQGILLIGDPRDRDPTTTCSASTGSRTCSPGIVNFTAGVIFVFAADVDWGVAGLIAAGSIVGGALGARYGRRLDPSVAAGADRRRRPRRDRPPARD